MHSSSMLLEKKLNGAMYPDAYQGLLKINTELPRKGTLAKRSYSKAPDKSLMT